MSMGNLAVVESLMLEDPTSEAWEAPVLVMPGVDGVSQGVACVEVDGAGPQLSDDVGGLLWDLVKRGTGINVPGSVAPGDAVPPPGSIGTTGLVLSGLDLPGSPGFLHVPIDWRQVGDEAESVCSQVTAMERLLHEMLASIDRNILHPIRVGLKRE
jgi:hypothetical protein